MHANISCYLTRLSYHHAQYQNRRGSLLTWTSYRRTSSRSSVDLPEPLGPTTAQLCPGSTFRLTALSTGLLGWYLCQHRKRI